MAPKDGLVSGQLSVYLTWLYADVFGLTSVGPRFHSGFYMHEKGRQSGLLVSCRPVWFVVPLGTTGRLLIASASHCEVTHEWPKNFRRRPPAPWLCGRGAVGEGKEPLSPPHAVLRARL